MLTLVRRLEDTEGNSIDDREFLGFAAPPANLALAVLTVVVVFIFILGDDCGTGIHAPCRTLGLMALDGLNVLVLHFGRLIPSLLHALCVQLAGGLVGLAYLLCLLLLLELVRCLLVGPDLRHAGEFVVMHLCQ